MSRRRVQQVVALLFVVMLIAGVLSIAAADPAPDSSAPTTLARQVDPERCADTVDEMTAFLDESFALAGLAGSDAATAAEAGDSVAGDGVGDQAVWDEFFTAVATTCPDIDGVVNDLVVFSHDAGEEAADVASALVPLFTTAQLCTITAVQFTTEVAEICVTAADEATEGLNAVFSDSLGGELNTPSATDGD